MGDLAIQMYEQLESKEWFARLSSGYYGSVYHWKGPAWDSLRPTEEAYRIGLQTGDM